MRFKYFLFPLVATCLLNSCSYLVPVGDGNYSKKTPSENEDEMVYESIWDFTNLNFGGNLFNATPRDNLITYCNSKQSANIVSTIEATGCGIYDTVVTSNSFNSTRLLIGSNSDKSSIDFKLNFDIKYIEVYAETYHTVNANNEILDFNNNSALHVKLKNQVINLSTSDNNVVKKSQKYVFEIEGLDYFNLYTDSSSEKVYVSKIVVGYYQNEKL